MELTRLILKNVRNYRDLVWEPGPGVNLLLGSNAQGKTNLLESIYYLSTFSSHRTGNDHDLVRWGGESFYMRGDFVRKGDPVNLEVGYSLSPGRKEIRLNGSILTRQPDAQGAVNAVMFTPEDLYLVKGYPQVRRQFLDREMVQINPIYGHYHGRYTRVLRQRNRLLKEGMGRSKGGGINQVEAWGSQLADFGSYILAGRREFVKKLSLLARLQHRKLTDGGEDLSIAYRSSLDSINVMENLSREIIREYYLKSLENMAEEEKRRGTTLVGPHRDDLDMVIDQRPARVFGSQGQQRTAALSMKLAQVELIKGERGSYPILLLDDVFSELDRERQEGLLGLIRGRVQTFITGTSHAMAHERAFREGAFYRVKEGRLSVWKS